MNKKDRDSFTRLILDERQRKLSTLGRSMTAGQRSMKKRSPSPMIRSTSPS